MSRLDEIKERLEKGGGLEDPDLHWLMQEVEHLESVLHQAAELSHRYLIRIQRTDEPILRYLIVPERQYP